MTNLAEIMEAIEKLAPEERAALRDWLDESDPDTMAVIRERVRQIRAGEAVLIDGDQVQQFREIEPGVRVCRVPNFPYAIYYIIESSEIIIVAVKHDRRDPGYWRHRIR